MFLSKWVHVGEEERGGAGSYVDQKAPSKEVFAMMEMFSAVPKIIVTSHIAR